VAAPNVIQLQYQHVRPSATGDTRYRIGTTGVASPGALRVTSVGRNHGSAGSIELEGVQLSPDRRGYNLVALEPDGRLLAAKAFDTFVDPAAATRLAAWIGTLPRGTIVAGAVRDEASRRLDGQAVRALATLGIEGDLRGRFREAHAFVGVKGADPGAALEALGARPIELHVGRIEPSAARAAPVGFELMEFALEPAATDGVR
jgi:hypothetical protein